METNGPLLPAQGDQTEIERAPFSVDQIDPSDRVAYDSLFYQTVVRSNPSLLEDETSSIDDKKYRLDGATAIPFFHQSGLNDAVLASIWQLSDIDQDGTLDRTEFALMMHLVRAVRMGIPLPSVLPKSLVPAAKALYANTEAVGIDQWTTFNSDDKSVDVAPLEAFAMGSDGGMTIADPSAFAVSPQEAGAFSSDGGFGTSQKRAGTQMPQYTLPGATFEQRFALEGEMNAAISKRREKQEKAAQQ